MPELPEVETVANGVHQRVHGQRIESVWLSSKPQTFKTAPEEMARALEGAQIDQVRRVGKHIVFDLRRDSPREQEQSQWIVHLGMTGRLLVSDPEVPLPPHTHAVLRLSSGNELRFVDPRRFGRLAIHSWSSPALRDEKAAAGGFTGPGREPLSISLPEFVALFRGRRLAIKAALLNQKLLHGVGNIYADESLFRAGISPRRMAGRLRKPELERLHAAVQSVLREAIALGGSSVSDYVDADGQQGFFQLEHKVYMRTGKPCPVCGSPIRRLVIGGRSTHYCPACQR
jgi:formamidopyrimidine-DNA glycosylase